MTGYRLFAEEGPQNLKIEVMARLVFRSKSSFYHHFTDLDLFIEDLLALHLERAKTLAEAEKLCQNIVPDLVELLARRADDLFFQRQLRVHRTNPSYGDCLQKVDRLFSGSLTRLWLNEFGLTHDVDLAIEVVTLATENFYLRLTPQTLTPDWLTAYFQQLRHTVLSLKAAKNVF
jgi:AcrR family transcriptional regulator